MCEREVAAQPVAVCPEGSEPELKEKEHIADDAPKGVDCVTKHELKGRYHCPEGFALDFTSIPKCIRRILMPTYLEQNPMYFHVDGGGDAITLDEVDEILASLNSCESGYVLENGECAVKVLVESMNPTGFGKECPLGFHLSGPPGHASCKGLDRFPASKICDRSTQMIAANGIRSVSKVMIVEGKSTEVLITCQPEDDSYGLDNDDILGTRGGRVGGVGGGGGGASRRSKEFQNRVQTTLASVEVSPSLIFNQNDIPVDADDCYSIMTKFKGTGNVKKFGFDDGGDDDSEESASDDESSEESDFRWDFSCDFHCDSLSSRQQVTAQDARC
eukprot:Selendium_serpulae@DN10376_c0_g1_i1.p1